MHTTIIYGSILYIIDRLWKAGLLLNKNYGSDKSLADFLNKNWFW